VLNNLAITDMKEKIIEVIVFNMEPERASLMADGLIILFNEHILDKFKESTDNNANNFMQSIWIKM